MKIRDKVVVVKTDKYTANCLNKVGVVIDIIPCKDGSMIYDVRLGNGMFSFLEDMVEKIL